MSPFLSVPFCCCDTMPWPRQFIAFLKDKSPLWWRDMAASGRHGGKSRKLRAHAFKCKRKAEKSKGDRRPWTIKAYPQWWHTSFSKAAQIALPSVQYLILWGKSLTQISTLSCGSLTIRKLQWSFSSLWLFMEPGQEDCSSGTTLFNRMGTDFLTKASSIPAGPSCQYHLVVDVLNTVSSRVLLQTLSRKQWWSEVFPVGSPPALNYQEPGSVQISISEEI